MTSMVDDARVWILGRSRPLTLALVTIVLFGLGYVLPSGMIVDLDRFHFEARSLDFAAVDLEDGRKLFYVVGDAAAEPTLEFRTPEGAVLKALNVNSRVEVVLLVLTTAFAFAAAFSVLTSWSLFADRRGIAVTTVVFAVFGWLLVSADPFAPQLTQDAWGESSNAPLESFITLRDSYLPERTAVEAPPPGDEATGAEAAGSARSLANHFRLLVSLLGLLAGATVGANLGYLMANVATPPNGAVGVLRSRRRNLLTVSAASAVTLCLGVAIISTILNWGPQLLAEADRKALSPLAEAGTSFWGGMFAIYAVTTIGLAGLWLHRDVDAEAQPGRQGKTTADSAQQTEEPTPPEEPKSAAAWKKENDLELEPWKAATASLLAVSPFLTATLANAGKAFG